ncbi:MAG: lipopolysaccharide heptosyltransferase I [Nitrospirae bacterium]|nr:lipopolysaccharide heptosyltransferase I [Nitrospirota bacterium]
MPKKLLIIKPSSLGDIVHSLPFLDVMKDSFPKAEIHWIIAKGLEGLLEDHPMVNKLWIINKDQWKSLKKIKGTISEVRQLFSALKKERYDITVDLQGLLRSGLLTNASRASVRVGFKEAREGSSLFYTHKVKGGKEVHAVDRYLKIAAALGCEATEVRFPMPLIRESQKVQRLKADVGQYAVIVPGARWKTKIWPAERFGLLTSMLNTKSIIIGSSSDAAIAEEIETLSGGRALSMAGKTDIKELISIIRDAGLVVTNDSGPMHIAAAFSRPVVAIFGPTNPVRTGPYSSNHTIVRADIKCAPCYKKSCKDTRCMDEISVEMVYEAIKKL